MNISFFLTTQQFKARTKTVTRRLGWIKLKPGTILQGVVKCQGLKKGEQVEALSTIKILSVTREPLNAITPEELIKEGFPQMSMEDFIIMFCSTHNKCTPETIITRIEFEYLD